MLPDLCISEAKSNLQTEITHLNKLKLDGSGVQMSYIDGYFTSWLEMRITEPKLPIVSDSELAISE